jgi:hypothetical protein
MRNNIGNENSLEDWKGREIKLSYRGMMMISLVSSLATEKGEMKKIHLENIL